LGTYTATYHLSTAATAAKTFKGATFGLSCYITALESDWGDAGAGTCSTVTYYGVTYSGSSTNPSGLPAGQYCNSFLATVKVNGSGVLKNGTTKVQYSSGSYPNWVFRVVSAITGSDGTEVIANQTLARDKTIIPGISNTHVQLPSGTYLANDVGGDITGYRLDIYKGAGRSNCPSNYANTMAVGACDHVTSACPGYAIQ
jgi:3D (Asp-Asp-Asp) domain-containing protein